MLILRKLWSRFACCLRMRCERPDGSLGFRSIWYSRQPFPGPGLGIRIIGEVTPEKVKIVQDADAIYREEIAKAGVDKDLGQYFAALTNMRSVGVMGDGRTYDYAIALRAVNDVGFHDRRGGADSVGGTWQR